MNVFLARVEVEAASFDLSLNRVQSRDKPLGFQRRDHIRARQGQRPGDRAAHIHRARRQSTGSELLNSAAS